MTYRELLAGNRDIRHLWAGQVISEVGDWLNNIAVLALTIELAGPGREGRAIALYALARHVPLFLFGPVAGVAVDRLDRRRVLIVADAARALLALGFLLANFFLSLPLIYLVGAALFAVSAFFNAARRAALPNLARDADELLGANALTASTTAATIAVGSALGGLVATLLGRETVFVLNSLTFLASAEMVRRVRAQTRAHGEPAPPAHAAGPRQRSAAARREGGPLRRAGAALRRAAVDFWGGLRYVRSDHMLAAVFAVAAGWGLGNGAARALYSIFGARLGEGAASGLVARPTDFGISVLFVAMGLGGVLGAPVARRFNQSADGDLGARMGRSLVLDGVGLTAFSLVGNLWGAALVLVAREMNFAIWWTAQQTMMMKRTADRYAGRVFATYETLTTLTMVGSLYASGRAADAYGIAAVAAAGGVVITLSGLLWFALGRRGGAAARAATSAGKLTP